MIEEHGGNSLDGELTRLRQRIAELQAIQTEQAQLVRTLRKEGERGSQLARAVEQSIGGVAVADMEGQIQFVNPAWARMHGYEVQELIGKHLSIFHSADQFRQEILPFLEQVKESGAQHAQVSNVHKDGTTFPTLMTTTLLTDEDGTPAGYVSTLCEITERKQAEALARRQVAVMDAVSRLFHESLICDSVAEIAHMCLFLAEALTESRFGFVGLVNQAGRMDTIALSNPGWDACSIPNSRATQVLENMEPCGIWGRVLRDGQSLIANEPAAHPDAVGIPEGHPPLNAFLGVPLQRMEETIGMIGLGNKEGGYNLADQQDVETLAVAFAEALHLEQMEEALRRSEGLYRAVTEAAVAGIGITDPAETLTFVNPALAEMLGYTQDELVGINLRELTLPEDLPKFQRMTERRMRGLADTYESRLRRKDGKVLHVLISASPLASSDASFEGALAVIVDITSSQEAEEKLRQRAAQLALLNDVGSQIAATVEPTALLERTAQLVQESFGYHHVALFTLDPERAELVMRARSGEFTTLYPPEHRIQVGQGMVGWVGRHGETIWANDVETEPRYVNLYPDTLPTRSELSVPIRIGREVVGVLDVQSPAPQAFDDNDVMVMETLADQIAVAMENARLVEGLEGTVAARTAELLAEKEKSETILRSVGDAITMSSLEWHIEYVNEAFASMTGYSVEEAIGQPTDFALVERMPEAVWRSLNATLARSETWLGEAVIRRKDGRVYDAALTIAPMRNAEGKTVGYVSSHRDISRAKALEAARSRFMSNVSHELRTPVTNVKLYAQLLRQGRRPERSEHFLQVIEEQADRLNGLIQNILVMAELDSGPALVHWEPVSLRHILADTITRYQAQAQDAGLALEWEPALADWPVVKGDQDRLTQALGALVENAIHFTPAGEQVLVQVETVEQDAEPWVTISVRDSGPGIPAQEIEQIFERLYRGSLAEAGHIPGSGLGLSIADEIVRAHGGRITVDSTVGEGSTFTIWLRPERGG